MEKLVGTYGKTLHTWHTDRQKDLPLGMPQLMMGFIADGQADASMVAARDERFKVSTEENRRRRADIPPPAIDPVCRCVGQGQRCSNTGFDDPTLTTKTLRQTYNGGHCHAFTLLLDMCMRRRRLHSCCFGAGQTSNGFEVSIGPISSIDEINFMVALRCNPIAPSGCLRRWAIDSVHSSNCSAALSHDIRLRLDAAISTSPARTTIYGEYSVFTPFVKVNYKFLDGL